MMTQKEALEEVMGILSALDGDEEAARKLAVVASTMMTFCLARFEEFLPYFAEAYYEGEPVPQFTVGDFSQIMQLVIAKLDPAGLVELLSGGGTR